MSNSMKSTGKTVDEAVREALLRMGLRREEVSVTVLQESRGGFLGMGRREAVVEVAKKSDRDSSRRRGGGRGRSSDQADGGGDGRRGRSQRAEASDRRRSRRQDDGDSGDRRRGRRKDQDSDGGENRRDARQGDDDRNAAAANDGEESGGRKRRRRRIVSKADAGRGRAGGRKSQRGATMKVEPTEEEVQKQVRETLEKLQGKSKKGKGAKYRRDKRDQHRQQTEMDLQQQERESKILQVTEFVTVQEVATMMNVTTTDIISACMALGIMVTMNQRLDAETLSIVAEEFGYTVEFVTADIEESIEETLSGSILNILSQK